MTDGDQTTEWRDALAADQLPPGGVAEVLVEGTIVALVNHDGEIAALDGLCAHQGGPLGKGRLCDGVLTCPWHGWQYNPVTGRQLESKTIRQRVFRTRVVGATIQVRLSPPSDG
ncbi:MAG: Rieske (2Fe-2S) protein [Lacipirellulaceae bacterium]